jgi:ABC-2 type transport system permease protein
VPGHLLQVAAKDLLIVAKDRGAWVFLLLTPLVVIMVASFALAPAFEGGSISAKLLVANDDAGGLGDTFTSSLDQQGVELIQATYDESEALKQGHDTFPAALVIPADFTQQVMSGQPVKLQVFADPSNNVARPYLLGLIDGAVTRISAVESAVKVAVVEVLKKDPNTDIAAVSDNAATAAAAEMENPPVQTEISNVGASAELNPFDTQAPGYSVMFMLFGVMTAAEGLLLEKESGTMGRLLVSPISKTSILGGKLLSQFLVGLVQITLLFSVGHFVFGMSLGNSLAGLALMIIVTAYTATAFGILLAGTVKTRRQLSAVGILTILLMSALGGSWWPLDIVPHFMQTIGHLTINAWALDGLNGLILRGEGFTDILPQAGVLFAYGCACFLLGISLFRFRTAS